MVELVLFGYLICVHVPNNFHARLDALICFKVRSLGCETFTRVLCGGVPCMSAIWDYAMEQMLRP